jgi:hypothetical protein
MLSMVPASPLAFSAAILVRFPVFGNHRFGPAHRLLPGVKQRPAQFPRNYFFTDFGLPLRCRQAADLPRVAAVRHPQEPGESPSAWLPGDLPSCIKLALGHYP